MAEWLDFARFDADALAASWRGARPFAHVILDGFLTPEGMSRLCAALDEEPAERYADEAFEFMATANDLAHPSLRDFLAAFGGERACAFWTRVSGRAVTRASMRGFAYQPGDYLLPHTDHQEGMRRALAYALYLDAGGLVEGGELELFACESSGGAMVRTEPVLRIAPRPGRLAVFEVGDHSLHRVREVLAGNRVSLAGWFYP